MTFTRILGILYNNCKKSLVKALLFFCPFGLSVDNWI